MEGSGTNARPARPSPTPNGPISLRTPVETSSVKSESSDVDILVRFAPGSSLFDLAHLGDELERILGRPVDVVSEGALKPRDQHIRAEAVRV